MTFPDAISYWTLYFSRFSKPNKRKNFRPSEKIWARPLTKCVKDRGHTLWGVYSLPHMGSQSIKTFIYTR